MARVLFLTQVLPYPLDAGPKVRQYHMLRYLAERHRVTLVSFTRPDDRPEAVTHLERLCAEVHTVPMRRSLARNVRAGLKSLATGLPLIIVRDEIYAMADTLRRLARQERFDVIHADQLSMALYGQLAAREMPGAATLLDEHNAVYLLTKQLAVRATNPVARLLMEREVGRMRHYEADMCRAFDATLTVTAEDRERLVALAPAAERAALARKLTVIPICVEPEHVQPAPVRPPANGTGTILHVGTMFWPPNVEGVLWFVREVLPAIRREVPQARFVVVGKAPPPEVQALAADPHIEVTGYVEDPAPYIAAADAFVVPLQVGEGMRVKILDAWLWGLPIVSTPVGAEGIHTEPGKNILLAADPGEFAAQVVRVLKEPGLNATLRTGGRAWVEANYAWQTVYRRVDQVYTELLDSRKAH